MSIFLLTDNKTNPNTLELIEAEPKMNEYSQRSTIHVNQTNKLEQEVKMKNGNAHKAFENKREEKGKVKKSTRKKKT